MAEFDQFLLINMTNRLNYLADYPVLSGLIGIFLCLCTVSLIGCLILIKTYLNNLHQLIKLHLVSSIIQQIVYQLVLFGIFVAMVIYRKQNWLTCTLTFRFMGGSLLLGMASTAILSIVRYYSCFIIIVSK